MFADCPSRTALRVAQRRAAHQVVDHPPIFADPLALRILGLDPDDTRTLPAGWSEGTPYARGLRAFLATRSRFAEERLRAAAERGIAQYLVLGAGLDTFGCRNPYPELRVFEVDHPATQHWKRRQLKAAGIKVPGSLRFVPVDFESQVLSRELARKGFDPDARTFVSWLGVSHYLDPATVADTLRWAASLPTGSAVVFDYAVAPELLEPRVAKVYAAIARSVAALGEPFRSGFDPAALAADLAGMGFSRVEDLGPEDLNARYFRDRPDGLRVGGFTRLAHAVL
jgi:methyltransferase (TIGR00027 family)